MANMQDIANKAGVSRATVSRVLSNHPSVKPETRKKVLYWIKKFNYKPNLIAQSLAGNSTNLIGVIVPEIAYPFFSEIIEAIESQASYHGYSIIIYNHNRNIDKEKNIISELKQRKVDGIISCPVSSKLSINSYKELQIPVVMITKKVDGFNSIFISHYNGGQQIAKHLLNLGFEKIGYIGPTKNSTSASKFLGFKDFLNCNNIKISDIIECSAPKNMNSSIVYENVKNYILTNGLKSEAFLANDDISACEAISAFKEMGYSVPKDIAIAVFDNSLLSKKMSPKLTSLAQPLEEIGKKAIDILLNSCYSNEKPMLFEMESRVIIRESTINWNICDSND